VKMAILALCYQVNSEELRSLLEEKTDPGVRSRELGEEV